MRWCCEWKMTKLHRKERCVTNVASSFANTREWGFAMFSTDCLPIPFYVGLQWPSWEWFWMKHSWIARVWSCFNTLCNMNAKNCSCDADGWLTNGVRKLYICSICMEQILFKPNADQANGSELAFWRFLWVQQASCHELMILHRSTFRLFSHWSTLMLRLQDLLDLFYSRPSLSRHVHIWTLTAILAPGGLSPVPSSVDVVKIVCDWCKDHANVLMLVLNSIKSTLVHRGTS